MGRGIVPLLSPWGEDGAMKCETIVFFYPQAIWVFMLLWLSLSEAMKAAGWLTSAGVVVTACDICVAHLLFPPFRRRFLHFPVVSPLRRGLFFLPLVTQTRSCLFFPAPHLNVSLGLPELRKPLN